MSDNNIAGTFIVRDPVAARQFTRTAGEQTVVRGGLSVRGWRAVEDLVDRRLAEGRAVEVLLAVQEGDRVGYRLLARVTPPKHPDFANGGAR